MAVSVLKKIQTNQRLKGTSMNRDSTKHANFRGKPFQATKQQLTVKRWKMKLCWSSFSCGVFRACSKTFPGAGIAQLLQRQTEKPGVILTRVRVRPSYGVRAAPVCNHTLEIPNTGSHIPLFGHMKILQTLIQIGSAALETAVPHPGKATLISR